MRRLLFAICVLGLAAVGLTLPQQSAVAAADHVVADWELNEGAGATVAVDSSGDGLNGAVDPTAADHGLHVGTTEGADTFYHWDNRCPTCMPVEDQRVVQVPENDMLDIPDATTTYQLEFRFRTNKPFGNFMQKGHSSTIGGQIKVQGPGGIVQCLFKGADGTRVGTGSDVPLDDNQWHTVQCIRNETQVKEFVDGVRVAVKTGSTGPIDNNKAFTIGGKNNCDQVAITCDYFVGDIDYVKVTTDAPTGGNLSPVAVFAPTCTNLGCSFDSTGTHDPDGTIDSYDWDFGDGTGHSTAANPSHNYTAPGTYNVTLTVTDNLGSTDKAVHGVTVTGAPPTKPLSPAATRGDQSATVSWSTPSSAGDSPITGYLVTSAPEGKTCASVAAVHSCTVSGLTNGQAYTFTIVAESTDGTSPPSDPTNAVHPAGHPGKVKGVHATAKQHSAVVTWSPANGNGAKVLHYRIVTSNGRHLVVAGSAHRAVFTNLKTGSSVRFRVRAINRVGAGAWSNWSPRVTIK